VLYSSVCLILCTRVLCTSHTRLETNVSQCLTLYTNTYSLLLLLLLQQVVNQGTDLRGLVATAGRGVGNVDAGDSIVYTLNVAAAGTYNVVYTLSGQSPSNGVDVKFSLFQGEQSTLRSSKRVHCA
jgi:hypothetical protein